MKKTQKLKLLAGMTLAALAGVPAHGAIIVSDNYTAVNSGSGFNLGSGVNSGINPPTTRLTGSAAANLRYIYTQTGTPKATSNFTIGSNKLKVAAAANSGRFTLSANGTNPFDYASTLGVLAATTNTPAVYDLTINMDNDSAGVQRFSFGIGTAENDVTTWDFGIQIYRAVAGDNFYTIQKRIDVGSSGTADINQPITTTAAGTFGTELSFLIRITDAGPESGADYHSRVQVSMDGGNSWFYDTLTDTTDLPNGWRFDAGTRYIMWDIAANAAATYDNFSVNSISTPTVQSRVWTGGGSDNNWSTAANWGGVAPVSGDSLVFDGVTRQANVNDIADLVVPSVTFSNGGFALSGSPWAITTGVTNLSGVNTFAGDLSWSSTFAKNWNVASGSELILNNYTVEVNGDHTLSGGGTLRSKGTVNVGQATTATPAFVVNEGKHIIDGGTFTSRGGYRIGSLATGSGAQTILTNGASFSLTVPGANLRVGDNSNSITSSLVIDHSTLSMAGGSIGLPYVAGSTGDVAQVGGIVSGAILNYNQTGVGRGIYVISNGTLEAIQIKKTTSGGTSRIHFDNAILRTASGASNAFFTGLNTGEIRSGGLVIDATTDITIGQNLSGAGTLTKSNSATVTLTGNQTYTGGTVVQNGNLFIMTGQTNANSIQVADGAGFGVVAKALSSSLSVSALNFTGNSFGTLTFDLASFSTPTASLLKATNVSVAGPVTINITNGLQLTTGQIVLVDYDGSISGGFNFTLGTLPPGVTATLVNNTANSSIDLNITGVPGLRWKGNISGDWDYSTQNWLDQQFNVPAAYTDGSFIEFYDDASTGFVNLLVLPTPGSVNVSNSTLPYVWSGGPITTSFVRKNGPGSLTRTGGEADIINGIELNGGSYILSNVFEATFTSVLSDITPNGTFVKQGSSRLMLYSTNNTYDGAVLIQEGTVKIGADRSLGAVTGGTTIANGATLDLNDMSPGAEPITVSGSGVSGQGAIVDTTTGGAVDTNLRDVTLAGDTTFGAPNGGRWDLRVRASTGAGPGLKGNGYKLTKVGSGYISIACQRNLDAATPYWQMNLGDIYISQGTLAFAESLSLGNPSASLVVSNGATLQLYDLGLTNPIVRTITLVDSRLSYGGGAADTNVINGGIQLTGANTILADQANMIVNGSIAGSGSVTLTANGTGTLILNGANTFASTLVVSNGVLAGTGSLAGGLTVFGGTNSPGYEGVGTFTVNGNLTMGSVTVMELNRNLSPNSDRLISGGTLAFGGTLNVVLAAGGPAPQSGDVYQLFNKAGTGSFSAINLPTLSGGRTWDTTGLSVNGSIKVVGGSTPPTISSVSSDGNNLVLSGTGGVAGGSYYVLSSTDVGAPLSSWTPVATNTFGPGGTFSYTNSINPSKVAEFFLLQVP